MRMLPLGSITTKVCLHETAAHGRVLEFVLTGQIPHERRDSAELYRQIGIDIRNALAQNQANALVLNLLDFDYSFGNEIGTILLGPYIALARSGGGKIAFIAVGRTASSLTSLAIAGLNKVFELKMHPNLETALNDMTAVPAAGTEAIPVSRDEAPAEAKAPVIRPFATERARRLTPEEKEERQQRGSRIIGLVGVGCVTYLASAFILGFLDHFPLWGRIEH